LDLSLGNRTPDEAVMERADADARVLVTKDDDFVQSRLLRGRPRQLLLVATGNVDNRSLEALVRAALPQIEKAFEDSQFVELGAQHLTVRD
jgi:predicted nuclease of predicted toxin-antitoxin system